MRDDREIMDLILSFARSDDRILGVYLKGSRANPTVPRDRYQDFDVMYVVQETESFLTDPSWLSHFGLILLKQEQKDDFGYGDRFGLRDCCHEIYSWLLLFEDGSRIDLGVETVSHLQKGSCRNKLFLPLLDKTGCLPQLPPPTDVDFHVKVPTEDQFHGCCNEFFWSLCDVVKGIARDEFPFAISTFYSRTHPMLEQMIEWNIGCHTNFSVSCGKQHKFFKKYLSASVYELYVQTHPDGTYPHFWDAISASCTLFHDMATETASHLHFTYIQKDEDAFAQYKRIVQSFMESDKK